MLTKENNELLTRVEGDAPMGKMLQQNYWVPAVRAARLEAGGAPVAVRLFGRDFVAYRGEDGKAGFLDQNCPHRRASLVLARNEDNALRCIFHGWKVSAERGVVEAPTQLNKPDEFCKRVKVRRYPLRDAGGIVWVWLGDGDIPPKFPDFEFTKLPENQVLVASQEIHCNWFQGVEAVVDGAHVGILHQSWLGKMVGYAQLTAEVSPHYDLERTSYGFRAAAIRDLPDGKQYVRINEFVMPWYGFTNPNDPTSSNRTLFFSVPVDDTHARQWFIRFNYAGPADKGFGFGLQDYDLDNFTPITGDANNAWGQNREAMKTGHFSGFPQNVLTEDMVVQVSMGPITDRSQEFLSDSDAAITQARRSLLQAAKDFQDGKVPLGAGEDVDHASVRATGGLLEPGQNWREQLKGGVTVPA
jgi:phthalate 4,5-dioxygenase